MFPCMELSLIKVIVNTKVKTFTNLIHVAHMPLQFPKDKKIPNIRKRKEKKIEFFLVQTTPTKIWSNLLFSSVGYGLGVFCCLFACLFRGKKEEMLTDTKDFSKLEKKEKCTLNPMPNFSLE